MRLRAFRPNLCNVHELLARSLQNMGRRVEALALCEEALPVGRRVLKKDSGVLLALEENRALALSKSGKHAEAAEVLEHLIEVQERSPDYGPTYLDTWSSRSALGYVLVEMGKFSEAIPLLRDSLAAYDDMGLGPQHSQLGIVPHDYARALAGAGRPAEAEPLFLRSIAFYESKHGVHHFCIPYLLIDLAEALGQMGHGFGERLSILDRAVTIRELSVGRDPDEDAELRAKALQACAQCYGRRASSTRRRRGGPSALQLSRRQDAGS